MPSTQTPPIAGAAIDPPSLRPPIDDAVIERVAPAHLHDRARRAARRDGYTMLLDLGAVDYLQRKPRFDVVYHLMKLAPRPASVAEVGTPARARILCGVDDGERCPRRRTSGNLPTGPSGRYSICSASFSTDTPICAGSRCRTIGKGTRFARIIRCAGPLASARRARISPTRPTSSRARRPPAARSRHCKKKSGGHASR